MQIREEPVLSELIRDICYLQMLRYGVTSMQEQDSPIRKIIDVLERYDPIHTKGHSDEYEVEAACLLHRPSIGTLGEFQQSLRDNLAGWSDEQTAGPTSRYEKLAEELWTILKVRFDESG